MSSLEEIYRINRCGKDFDDNAKHIAQDYNAFVSFIPKVQSTEEILALAQGITCCMSYLVVVCDELYKDYLETYLIPLFECTKASLVSMTSSEALKKDIDDILNLRTKDERYAITKGATFAARLAHSFVTLPGAGTASNKIKAEYVVQALEHFATYTEETHKANVESLAKLHAGIDKRESEYTKACDEEIARETATFRTLLETIDVDALNTEELASLKEMCIEMGIEPKGFSLFTALTFEAIKASPTPISAHVVLSSVATLPASVPLESPDVQSTDLPEK